MSAIEKLKKIAEKHGESPLDFYDHLVVAKKNAAISPLYKQSLEKEEKYDEKSDPYVNACKYYKECAFNGIQDPEVILALTREEVSKMLTSDNSKTLDALFQQLNKASYEGSGDVNNWKRTPINDEFIETMCVNEKVDNKEYDKIIRDTRFLLKTTLEDDLFNGEKDQVRTFIQENRSSISQMRIRNNSKVRTIRLKKDVWNKVEGFRPSNSDDLSTHDLIRGVYLLVLKFVLDGKKH
ncbi:hypothetical protein [Porphyromonas somerae]|uniref:hypothetical protein n=1 Tax=Porphyromonas somerae TaxID=322095 RepID=UPI001FCA97F9|nr:hypothetical protein [Porphyromonas somerae]BDE81932.1 hypothetical protein CE91St14_09600 [Porphyromonas somerae]